MGGGKKWGKGSYEAIVCSEVANNANVGGSMLPTLTLGIPGNAAAAAILAALELKNVVVGPSIEIEHPGLIYFIYIALTATFGHTVRLQQAEGHGQSEEEGIEGQELVLDVEGTKVQNNVLHLYCALC